jgi:hypothetical protein
MSHRWNSRAVLLAGALLAALPSGEVRGESQGQAKPANGATHASAPRKDEQALAALKEMSAALAGAQTMRFNVRSFVPMKAASGWVTLVGTANVMREGKERLAVETGGDLFPFHLTFDGKTVTAFAPEEKIYAQRESPGTIDQMLDRAAKNGEAVFVFADLVSSDPYTAMTRGLKSAKVVGTSTIDGVETEHLAVGGERVNWEIWIGTKDRLPRLVTLKDTADAQKPSQTVQLSGWALNEPVPADAFTFNKPEDATEVPFKSPKQALTASGRRAPAAHQP